MSACRVRSEDQLSAARDAVVSRTELQQTANCSNPIDSEKIESNVMSESQNSPWTHNLPNANRPNTAFNTSRETPAAHPPAVEHGAPVSEGASYTISTKADIRDPLQLRRLQELVATKEPREELVDRAGARAVVA